jgi:hypothetical protein
MFTNLPLIAAVFARSVVAMRNAAKYVASGTLSNIFRTLCYRLMQNASEVLSVCVLRRHIFDSSLLYAILPFFE